MRQRHGSAPPPFRVFFTADGCIRKCRKGGCPPKPVLPVSDNGTFVRHAASRGTSGIWSYGATPYLTDYALEPLPFRGAAAPGLIRRIDAFLKVAISHVCRSVPFAVASTNISAPFRHKKLSGRADENFFAVVAYNINALGRCTCRSGTAAEQPLNSHGTALTTAANSARNSRLDLQHRR